MKRKIIYGFIYLAFLCYLVWAQFNIPETFKNIFIPFFAPLLGAIPVVSFAYFQFKKEFEFRMREKYIIDLLSTIEKTINNLDNALNILNDKECKRTEYDLMPGEYFFNLSFTATGLLSRWEFLKKRLEKEKKEYELNYEKIILILNTINKNLYFKLYHIYEPESIHYNKVHKTKNGKYVYKDIEKNTKVFRESNYTKIENTKNYLISVLKNIEDLNT